jgi:hypothetical protein
MEIARVGRACLAALTPSFDGHSIRLFASATSCPEETGMRWVEEAQGGKLTRTRGKGGERRCGCVKPSPRPVSMKGLIGQKSIQAQILQGFKEIIKDH